MAHGTSKLDQIDDHFRQLVGTTFGDHLPDEVKFAHNEQTGVSVATYPDRAIIGNASVIDREHRLIEAIDRAGLSENLSVNGKFITFSAPVESADSDIDHATAVRLQDEIIKKLKTAVMQSKQTGLSGGS